MKPDIIESGDNPEEQPVKRSIFRNLFLSMVAFGVLVGLIFPPFARIVLSSERALSIEFFVMCVLAGFIVGLVNFFLFRVVVSRNLARLVAGMQKVLEGVTKAEFMGEQCAEGCMLEITSNDMIGEIEQSFNNMTEAIARRLTLEEISQSLHAKLSDTVELNDVAKIILTAIIENKSSKVGALYGDNGEFYELLFDFGLDRREQLPKNLNLDDGPVSLALESGNILSLSPQCDELEWVEQTTPLGKFRPKNMLAIPLMSKGKAVGLVLSAGDKAALSSQQLQILESIRKQGSPYLQSAILHRKIRDLAALDDLTMILNRRFGLRRLREEFSRSVRHGVPLSVLMVDVDYFKKFNDSYGHDAGDEILKMVARTIESDIRSGDVICRYGGEEFMLVAPGTGLNDAAKLGERVRRTIEATQVNWRDQLFQVTVSIGVATWPMAGVSVSEELISAADQALYNAKESGRNQVEKNWGDLLSSAGELIEVEQEL